jgi:predicted transposase YbfD/YdcC
MEKLFVDWVRESYGELVADEQVCIDGKTVKGSRSPKTKTKAIHNVSAWAAKGGYVFGQLKTEDKSNEITAIPELLNMLFIKGCIVSIDAMGCQKDIAECIVSKKSDYVFSLKGNQTSLHDDIKLFFEDTIANGNNDFTLKTHSTVDGDHGRVETRTIYTCDDISWLHKVNDWAGIRSISCVKSVREIDEITTTENRYFISSLSGEPTRLLRAVRTHWAIENSLHWQLDVSFNEDNSMVRHRNAARVFALMRKLCFNAIKKVRVKDYSIKTLRKGAAWDPDYREQILMAV